MSIAIGDRAGRLTVVERAASVGGKSRWLCACACGKQILASGSNLVTGNTSSCGCLRREKTRARRLKHGFSTRAEYLALVAARLRCRSEADARYTEYGGRGIEYRFPDDLGEATALLIAAIGPRPTGTSLDRIDNDGHYEIGNLRWATASEQQHNTRRVTEKAGGA